MDKPQIYADLNKWEEVEGQFRVILTTRGTHEDLQKHGLTLKEGMTLDFWTDDGDAEGNSDPLYFQGVVTYDPKANCWTAAVNPEAIHHASEEKSSQKAEPVFA